ncbi:MAG: DNA repair protein RadC [Firmicutes bacterium]|nr:DNA repair protein RadC [Bacillota bacterium]
MVKIKEIPVNDRPRERLINSGSNTLSNEELLAIILDTGTKDKSAKDLAISVLSKINHISELKDINYQNLISIKGIGISKATKILSLIELSKRINVKLETLNNIKANNSKVIYEYFKDKLMDEKQEYFYCLYLNNKKRIIKNKLLYIGTINQTLIHPRDIFKEAYLLSASAIICIHNHPSGNTAPSKEDIMMTKNLKEVGLIMGINVVDHIIIGKNSYYSFFENGDI